MDQLLEWPILYLHRFNPFWGLYLFLYKRLFSFACSRVIITHFYLLLCLLRKQKILFRETYTNWIHNQKVQLKRVMRTKNQTPTLCTEGFKRNPKIIHPTAHQIQKVLTLHIAKHSERWHRAIYIEVKWAKNSIWLVVVDVSVAVCGSTFQSEINREEI